jgi:5-carboxyvanillate decarboxylase
MIDTECHYSTASYVSAARQRSEAPRQEVDGDYRRSFPEPSAPDVMLSYPAILEQRLLDLGKERIAVMDEHSIDQQVISLTVPGTDVIDPAEGLPLARESNDALAEAVKLGDGRFIGLATLAPMDAEESAAELERCVSELGFRGANIHSHVGDLYLDDKRFWPIFAAAERLEVPINIHPTLPHGTMVKPYLGYGWTLPGPGLGFGQETAVQVSRMIYAGVFDAHPNLQLMLGHCGEALPFWMYRLDFPYLKPYIDHYEEHPKLERLPSQYLSENVWYNCSGNFWTPAFLACLHAIGASRMLFASDYPYETYEDAISFAESLPVSSGDREKILRDNAANLFGQSCGR